MDVAINSWTFIFLFAAAQGLFLAVLIFTLNKGVKQANHILASVILLFSLSLVYYVAFWTGYENHLHPVISLPLSFVWLFGPLLFFYFKALNGSKPEQGWLWHFLPFGLAFFNRLANIFDLQALFGLPSFSGSGTMIPDLLITLQLVHLFSYAVAINTYQQKHIFPKNISNTQRRWLRRVSLFYVGFCLSYSSYYLLVWSGMLKIEYDYVISLVMSIFIYMTGYFGFKNPEILQAIDNTVKYEKSSLSKSASETLVNKLLFYMDHYQPYTNSELKLTELANQLDTSPHHLSQVINQNLRQNFSDFINNYRIRHAKILLKQQDNSREKIINIAYDSGFNNKVSFNTAFKKFEGVSPSAFRKK